MYMTYAGCTLCGKGRIFGGTGYCERACEAARHWCAGVITPLKVYRQHSLVLVTT